MKSHGVFHLRLEEDEKSKCVWKMKSHGVFQLISGDENRVFLGGPVWKNGFFETSYTQ